METKSQWEEIRFLENDKIAVIAPHPDDECLGAASALLMAPEKTDIYVLTDGSHGNPEKSYEEEAIVRRRQFEDEMVAVKPHAYYWFGLEDTTLGEDPDALSKIDFTRYTKVFLPWSESLHPDHREAAKMCKEAIIKQKAKPDCYVYEITAPFQSPTHYVDITALEQRKREIFRYHADQAMQEDITLSLNEMRGNQMVDRPEVVYAEAFLKLEVYDEASIT